MADSSLDVMQLPALRKRWKECWGLEPPLHIGRSLLVKSIVFKQRQDRGEGMTSEQQKRLSGIIKAYKRNPKSFAKDAASLKPGMRVVKLYNGVRHSVLVRSDGFEYHDQTYTSLSEIAYFITGTRWNGWVFFGLKKRGST
jgi:hypothetical protein